MTTRSILILSILLVYAFTTSATTIASVPERLILSLAECEQLVLKNSGQLQALEREAAAATHGAEVQRSFLLPTLSLDGNWRYVSQVPELKIGVPPRETRMSFGDHQGWSTGATAAFTLWDWGNAWGSWDAARSVSGSKRSVWQAGQRQLRLAVRLAYFQLLLNAEQVRLFADTLNVAQAQYRDIQIKYREGSANKIDRLSAHQEVLNWKRQLRQARADLTASLRDLYALTGRKAGPEADLPMDDRRDQTMPAEIEPPTAVLHLDPIPDLLTHLALPNGARPDDSIPQVQVFARQAEAYHHALRSALAAQWPRIQIQARSSYEYPNGPVLENVQQNSVSAALSMPLWDWGRTGEAAAQAGDQAAAAEARMDQVWSDTVRDWTKANDQLHSLSDQHKLIDDAMAESQEAAGLVYEAYRNGRLNYLDVESANLKALQAKILLVRNNIQTLMQTAILSSLAKEE